MFGADSGGNGNNENRRKVWIMSLKLTMKMEIFWQEEGTQGTLLLMSISIETNQMLGMIESHNSLGMEIFKDNMAVKDCK